MSIILIIIFSYGAYAEPSFPSKLSTNVYVQDYAGMISKPTVAKILEEARQVDLKTTAQISIVTINSLEGYSIEEYANGLFRKWGIGNKTKNNGILLLLSRLDREIRIEVGYGLESRINDAKAGRMIQGFKWVFEGGKQSVKVEFMLLCFGYNLNKLHKSIQTQSLGVTLYKNSIP